ncbi:MAG: hypothetical protein JSV24_02825, partial [Bacteroidales bacterium]
MKHSCLSKLTFEVALTVLLVMNLSIQGFSQLSGAYTIDPSGGPFPNFVSFNAALDSLKSQGVSGPVVITAVDGDYSERLWIREIEGASAVNTITFQGNESDSSLVRLHQSSDGPNNYVVAFSNNTSHFIFRKMKIEATSTSLYARVVGFYNGADSIIVENCILMNYQTGSTNHISAIIYAYETVLKNVIIRNNYVLNGSHGFFVDSHSGAISNDVRVLNNEFRNQNTRCVVFEYVNDAIVNNNTIWLENKNTYGIWLWECDNNTSIQGNTLIMPDNNNHGIRLSGCQGNAANKGIIANNFISHNPTSTSYHAIWLENSSYQKVVHNSVYHASGFAAFYVSGGNNNIVRNNIFANFGGGYPYYLSGAGVVSSSDYNNYFSTTNYIARWGNDYKSSLEELQAVTEDDAHSVSVNPNFISFNDLHTTTSWLDGIGDPGVGITEDIDGETRLSPPDIGADEFTASGTPLSGPYTIGGTTPDYLTFNDAVDDLMEFGISSSVVFNVRDDSYNEQIKILPIAGADASNTITFQSESGDSTKVILEYASGSTNNWVVRFQSADYITFRQMTLSAIDPVSSRVIGIYGNSNNI